MHGGELCKGGNGMFETKMFWFEERDSEFMKTIKKKRKPELNYCDLDEVMMKIRRLKDKDFIQGGSRLAKAMREQSTYYGLH